MGKYLDISEGGLGIQVARRISITAPPSYGTSGNKRSLSNRSATEAALASEMLEQLVGLGPEVREP